MFPNGYALVFCAIDTSLCLVRLRFGPFSIRVRAEIRLQKFLANIK